MPATKKEVYDPISGGRDPNRTYQLGGGRASGGPVYPGYAYQVGEHGPETLYMGAGSGYVQPYASHYTLPAQSVGGNSQLTVTVRTERGEVLGIVRSEFRNSSNGRYVARLLGDYAGSTG